MAAQRDLLFRNLAQVADSLHAHFGPLCEVVIHDLARPESSIVHIAGDLTGRHIGGPMTDFVLGLLKREEKPEDVVGYLAHTREGATLKSSTVFIRDKDGAPIGVFCINFDVTPLLAAAQDLGRLASPNISLEVDKSFPSDVPNLLRDMIPKSLKRVLDNGEYTDGTLNVTPEERRMIVADLEDQGAFRIRNATSVIADLFKVSRYTIYKDRNAISDSERTRGSTTSPEEEPG